MASIYESTRFFWRRIQLWWRQFRFDPYWRALTEVLVTVLFTFFPIILISTPILKGGDEISQANVFSNFLSYWNSGELALPILGLCGTLVALIALNSHFIARFWRIVGGIVAVVVAVWCGYLLGTNRGFDKDLFAAVVAATFIVYLIIVILWFVLAAMVHRESASGVDSEKRIDRLMAEKERREAGMQ